MTAQAKAYRAAKISNFQIGNTVPGLGHRLYLAIKAVIKAGGRDDRVLASCNARKDKTDNTSDFNLSM